MRIEGAAGISMTATSEMVPSSLVKKKKKKKGERESEFSSFSWVWLSRKDWHKRLTLQKKSDFNWFRMWSDLSP